jgi:integrase
MSAFKARGRRILETKVPKRDGSWVKRSTGTKDKMTARAIDRMIEQLGAKGKHAWEILEAVTSTPARWTLSDLWRRWSAVTSDRVDGETGDRQDPSIDERIKALRTQLVETDLEPLVEKFRKVMEGPSSGISADTAAHYVAGIRTLIPKGTPFYRSQLTAAALTAWIEGMEGVKPGTVRKRGDGMRRFTAWLKRNGHVDHDAMRDVKLPAAGDPRVLFLDTPDAQRLADAQPGQYRNYAALLAGTGIEVSVALQLRRRDVDEKHKEIRAAGTKTYTRDRVVRVAEWAWPYVQELVKGKHPDAKLFDAIPDRWKAQDAHKDAVAALVEKGHKVYRGYTMRDHRHTWAVRAVRSGWPIEAVARQLGHVDGVLALKVYGRFQPTQSEREKWEAMATERDRQVAKEQGE